MLDEERKVHYIGNLDDYDASFHLLVVLSRLKMIKFIGMDNHVVFIK
jgi:hypothetical protein